MLLHWERVWIYGVFDADVHELASSLERVDNNLGHANDRERRANLQMGDLGLPDLTIVALDDVLQDVKYGF